MFHLTKTLFFLLLFSVSFCFAEEEQLTVETVRIVGNTKTKDFVVWRLMELKPGSLADYSKIRKDEESLKNSDFFSEVNIKTYPGNLKGTLVLEVQIKERKYPKPDLGVIYNDDGWTTYAGFRGDNFFGLGNQTSLNYLIYGQKLEGLEFNVFTPQVWGKSGYLGINVYDYKEKVNFQVSDTLYTQKVDRDGFELFVGRQSFKSRRYFVTFKADYVEPDTVFKGEKNVKLNYFEGKVPSSDLEEIKNSSRLQKNIAFAFTVYQDKRNNKFFPTSGYFLKGNAELSNEFLGSDSRYLKTMFDARLYKNFYQNNTFAFRVSGGWVSEEAPYFKKFYLDGINEIRGFPNGAIAPIGGGTKYLLFNSELRFPLPFGQFPKQHVTLVTFYDSGRITRELEDFGRNGFTSAFGLGARLRIPFFEVVSVDFGWPIDKEIKNNKETKKIGKLSIIFSLGFKF
ncbi:BamA/TamA family outer membrane protein [bacterium]|nr:BamA/TamA family outer membrane protein [bacterium]